MSVRAEPLHSVFDTIKIIVSVALVVAGIGGFYYYGEYSLFYRVLALVGVSVISLGFILTTDWGQSLWEFMKDARTEVRKVIWPTRQETVQTTMIVMLMVLIVGVFLWLLDMFFLWGVRLLTGQGS